MFKILHICYLVDFQNSKIQLRQQDDFEGCLYNSSGTSFVGITTENMLYTGEVEDDELYHNFIMIHDKMNGKVRLLQVDHCVASPKLNKKNFSSSTVLSNTESTVSELHKQFGSKATKRLTEQRERLTMNIDAVKDQLEKTVSSKKLELTCLSFYLMFLIFLNFASLLINLLVPFLQPVELYSMTIQCPNSNFISPFHHLIFS